MTSIGVGPQLGRQKISNNASSMSQSRRRLTNEIRLGFACFFNQFRIATDNKVSLEPFVRGGECPISRLDAWFGFHGLEVTYDVKKWISGAPEGDRFGAASQREQRTVKRWREQKSLWGQVASSLFFPFPVLVHLPWAHLQKLFVLLRLRINESRVWDILERCE